MTDFTLLILAAPMAIGALTGVALAIWGDRQRRDTATDGRRLLDPS